MTERRRTENNKKQLLPYRPSSLTSDVPLITKCRTPPLHCDV